MSSELLDGTHELTFTQGNVKLYEVSGGRFKLPPRRCVLRDLLSPTHGAPQAAIWRLSFSISLSIRSSRDRASSFSNAASFRI